jgi:hypothetical protein
VKRGVFALCTGLLLAGLVPGAILAAAGLDAHSEAVSYGWAGSPAATYAQTFTVGTTGKLTAVDLRLDSTLVTTTADVKIEALDGSGNPNGTALTSGSATVPTATAWVSVALTPYSVTSGHVYALVFTLNAPSSGQWEVYGSITNPYAGGEAMDASNGWHPLQNSTTEDFGFRTFIDPAVATKRATPPPTSTASDTAAGTDGGNPVVLLIAGGLAASAAFVTFRRYGLARR